MMSTDPINPIIEDLAAREATLRIPRLLRRAEVASLLGVSDRTLRKLHKAGMLKALRIGGSYRYHPEDIIRLTREGWSI